MIRPKYTSNKYMGGAYADWQNNVDDLEISYLMGSTEINAGIVDCYDVTGPFTVTVIIDGIGKFN